MKINLIIVMATLSAICAAELPQTLCAWDDELTHKDLSR